MENENNGDTNCYWCAPISNHRIRTGTGGHYNKSTVGDHLDNCIIETGQNTEKTAGDLRRLVTQTPVRNYQLNDAIKKSLKE